MGPWEPYKPPLVPTGRVPGILNILKHLWGTETTFIVFAEGQHETILLEHLSAGSASGCLRLTLAGGGFSESLDKAS